ECSDTAVNSNIVVTNSFVGDFTYNPSIICTGDTVAFTDISTLSADSYLWRFGDGNLSASRNTTHIYNNAGTYIAEFEIRKDTCASISRDTLTVRPLITAGFSYSAPACEDALITFTDASTASPSNWLWTFHDGSSAAGSTATFVYDSAGSFQVQLAVVDSFCGTDAIQQAVPVIPVPFFYLGDDTSICLSESILLTAVQGADSYQWSTGDTTPSITFTAVPATVWATAFLNGCSYADSILINERTADCSFAIVPSGFSPNNDGHNDRLIVKTKRVAEYEIIIYNRWGEEVYRGTNNDLAGWDGTYKDEPQDMGVFSYVITWRNLSNDKFVNGGSITLVR
ncbi:MAG TPA: PKD domain-containing protein, partial [Chitinophagales bacterium]|nr:PKD domain-containing protein [Chitinophagales bacterium]